MYTTLDSSAQPCPGASGRPDAAVAVEVKLKNTVAVELGGLSSRTFFLLAFAAKAVELVVVIAAVLCVQVPALAILDAVETLTIAIF